jgi:hypothetical protein
MKNLIELLEEGQTIYLSAASEVADEVVSWRPGENRWSVLECAEHVANVEHRIFRTIQKAPSTEPSPEDPQREREIYDRVAMRSTPVPAPEMVRPSGRYASLSEALAAFIETRRSAIEFLKTSGRDLRSISAVHPILGSCSGYEYVIIMAAHPVRHAGQIREILEAYRAANSAGAQSR